MPRVFLTLFVLLALSGFAENTQGQSKIAPLQPADRPQLELEVDLGDEDALSLSETDDEADGGMDDELDSDLDSDLDDEMDSELDDELDSEEDSITPQRLSDDQIRSNWPKHSIATIGLSLAESERVPEDRSDLLEGFGRNGLVSDTVKVFAWEAPSIKYQPLYFEDVVLERYGQTLPDYRQSIKSGIYFGAAVTGLALQIQETPPRTCDSSLGYCRPGTCVPQTTQRHFFGGLSLR